jgi:hypothetical protein
MTRVCIWCGRVEIDKSALDGFNEWLKQPGCDNPGTDFTHTWRDLRLGEVIYQDGRPCKHPGCRGHFKHPCEGCGRIGMRGIVSVYEGIL